MGAGGAVSGATRLFVRRGEYGFIKLDANQSRNLLFIPYASAAGAFVIEAEGMDQSLYGTSSGPCRLDSIGNLDSLTYAEIQRQQVLLRKFQHFSCAKLY